MSYPHRKPVPGLFNHDRALTNTQDQAQKFMAEMMWDWRHDHPFWDTYLIDARRCSVARFFNACKTINCELEMIGFNIAGSKFT